jgi:hypothetical protein
MSLAAERATHSLHLDNDLVFRYTEDVSGKRLRPSRLLCWRQNRPECTLRIFERLTVNRSNNWISIEYRALSKSRTYCMEYHYFLWFKSISSKCPSATFTHYCTSTILGLRYFLQMLFTVKEIMSISISSTNMWWLTIHRLRPAIPKRTESPDRRVPGHPCGRILRLQGHSQPNLSPHRP